MSFPQFTFKWWVHDGERLVNFNFRYAVQLYNHNEHHVLTVGCALATWM